AFHRSGGLTRALKAGALKKTCGAPVSYTAWVGHRLGKREELTPQAGKKLGTELSALLSQGCFAGVSLDVEPLPAPPSWLGPFLQGMKSSLSLLLSLAIPPVS